MMTPYAATLPISVTHDDLLACGQYLTSPAGTVIRGFERSTAKFWEHQLNAAFQAGRDSTRFVPLGEHRTDEVNK